MKTNVIARIVEWVSGIRASDTQLIALFATTVIVRNLLESLTSGLLFPAPAFIFHFPIAYVFPMLGLTGLMHLLSGYPLRKLLRVMVFAWTLTLLPPFLDFLIGSSSSIGYFPLNRNNAAFFLINFFNPAVDLTGTTAGIRIEAAIGCILAGVFTWAVASDKRVFRGIATTVFFAPVFLVFFTWPSLVYLLTINHFPYSSTVQEYFQWHAVTAPHLTGSLHYTVFIVDLLPVTLILAWFFRILNREAWNSFAVSVKHSLWEAAVPIAGTLTVYTAASGAITFADAISITGALLAAILILFSRNTKGIPRTAMLVIAISAALAVGWSTTAFAMLAMAVILLPGPSWISRVFSAPVFFLLASSPAGFSWEMNIIPVLTLCLLTMLVRRPIPGTIAGILALISAVLFSPVRSTSLLEYYTWLNDAVKRNGGQSFSLPISTVTTAAGGDMLDLAKAELDDGDINRAVWAYEIAVIEGNNSPDAYKTGLNLAFSRGETDEFENLMTEVLADPDLLENVDVARIIIARAMRDTDTLFIQRVMERSGPSPQLFHAFSAACSMNGDLERAGSWARAAISHPDAQADHYAWAINVTAMQNGNYDSLYTEGIERFPGSTVIMSSRLIAPVTSGVPPDREDILDRCITLNPGSASILRTAAVWYLHAGRPEEAMKYAQRAIAASREPDSALLRIACLAALEAGDSRRMSVHAGYASELYPEDEFFSQILSDSASLPSPASPDDAAAE